jgi:hypothetical protein
VNATIHRAAVALLLGAALGGCSQPHITDPGTALMNSLDGIKAGRYSFDVTFPYAHLAGSIDNADHQAHWTSTLDNQPGRIFEQDLVIGPDMYVADSGGGGTPGNETPLTVQSWRHFDLSQDPYGMGPAAEPDVERIRSVVESMRADSADGDTIRGTLDLSTLQDPSPDINMVTAWADAGPLPATAKLDDHGRLVEFSADLPDQGKLAPAGRLVVKLSAYGARVAEAPRPTNTSEAP